MVENSLAGYNSTMFAYGQVSACFIYTSCLCMACPVGGCCLLFAERYRTPA